MITTITAIFPIKVRLVRLDYELLPVDQFIEKLKLKLMVDFRRNSPGKKTDGIYLRIFLSFLNEINFVKRQQVNFVK